MSTYFTISGSITYKTREAFDKAFDFLNKGGWIADGKWFQSEYNSGALYPDDDPEASPNIDVENLTITIPGAYYRNLASHFDVLAADGDGEFAWTSTDGMFSGGVVKIKDGKLEEKNYDLAKWWAEDEEGKNDPAPSIDDGEAYCEWMNNVEHEFIEEFQP